jgi:hypothetical protein
MALDGLISCADASATTEQTHINMEEEICSKKFSGYATTQNVLTLCREFRGCPPCINKHEKFTRQPNRISEQGWMFCWRGLSLLALGFAYSTGFHDRNYEQQASSTI